MLVLVAPLGTAIATKTFQFLIHPKQKYQKLGFQFNSSMDFSIFVRAQWSVRFPIPTTRVRFKSTFHRIVEVFMEFGAPIPDSPSQRPQEQQVRSDSITQLSITQIVSKLFKFFYSKSAKLFKLDDARISILLLLVDTSCKKRVTFTDSQDDENQRPPRCEFGNAILKMLRLSSFCLFF